MKFTAEIKVMPLKELLDPQGKAIQQGLGNLGMKAIEEVRIGKHIQVTVEARNSEEAKTIVDTACKKLLANPVMEYFETVLHEAG